VIVFAVALERRYACPGPARNELITVSKLHITARQNGRMAGYIMLSIPKYLRPKSHKWSEDQNNDHYASKMVFQEGISNANATHFTVLSLLLVSTKKKCQKQYL